MLPSQSQLPGRKSGGSSCSSSIQRLCGFYASVICWFLSSSRPGPEGLRGAVDQGSGLQEPPLLWPLPAEKQQQKHACSQPLNWQK